MPIEKNDGCNHMTCSRCGQHFCWICKKTLDKNNYRDHFDDLGNRYYDDDLYDDYPGPYRY